MQKLYILLAHCCSNLLPEIIGPNRLLRGAGLHDVLSYVKPFSRAFFLPGLAWIRIQQILARDCADTKNFIQIFATSTLVVMIASVEPNANVENGVDLQRSKYNGVIHALLYFIS